MAEKTLLRIYARLMAAEREYHAVIAEAQADGAKLVRGARDSLGLTQRELAAQMGIDFSYVSKIETGKAVLSKPFFRALVRLIKQREILQ